MFGRSVPTFMSMIHRHVVEFLSAISALLPIHLAPCCVNSSTQVHQSFLVLCCSTSRYLSHWKPPWQFYTVFFIPLGSSSLKVILMSIQIYAHSPTQLQHYNCSIWGENRQKGLKQTSWHQMVKGSYFARHSDFYLIPDIHGAIRSRMSHSFGERHFIKL